MTNTFAGEWELYVVTDGTSLEWPEHSFERTTPVPTAQERENVLALLGYAIPDDAVWEWQELPNSPMDRVELLASIGVRPTGGA
ncbi:DUF6303 family protein [Streptomyces sp. NPDC007861]|uniref:DUF6303 family protein n=1 Tax=Streptomyces sp. NPDC007861 TaxID=3154893 RepID=UPI0033C477B6